MEDSVCQEIIYKICCIITGLPSPSSSFGSSLGASHDFRRMFKPPNKKKYEEEMDKVIQEIKSKEAEMVRNLFALMLNAHRALNHPIPLNIYKHILILF